MKHKSTLRKIRTAVVIAACAMAIDASAKIAYDFTVDGIYYRITGENTVSVGYNNISNSYTGDVTIPGSVTNEGKTYTVTAIADSAFNGSSSLTSIFIPKTIKAIGFKAFNGCSKLKTTNIEDLDAWLNIDFKSTNLYSTPARQSGNITLNGQVVTSVVFPDTMTAVKPMVLASCEGIKSVTLPSQAKSIGYAAFYGCKALQAVVIPEKVETIERNAFYNCYELALVDMPNSVKRIGKTGFYNCKKLAEINFSNTLERIDSSAFMNCYVLEKVELPNSLRSMQYRSFAYCTALKSADIPEGVEFVGVEAFRSSSAIKSIYIPSTADSISYAPFSGCKAANKVTFADSPNTLTVGTSTSAYTFNSCPVDTLYLGRNIRSVCSKSGTVKSLDGIKTLVALTIGENVTDITDLPAASNTSLATITCKGNTPPASNEFSSTTYSSAKLIVPNGTKTAYQAAEVWKNFLNIEEQSAGIDDINVSDESANAPAEYYNLQGVRVAEPTNGLFIKVQNGKATKVLVAE